MARRRLYTRGPLKRPVGNATTGPSGVAPEDSHAYGGGGGGGGSGGGGGGGGGYSTPNAILGGQQQQQIAQQTSGGGGGYSVPSTVPASQNTQRPAGSASRVTSSPRPQAPSSAQGRGRGAVLARIMQGLSPEQQALVPDVLAASREYGISADALMGLIQIESNFTPGLTSSAGAQGVTQFMPGTAQQYGVDVGTSPEAIRSQVRGAAAYLRDLGFNDDPIEALAQYNGGTNPPDESYGYAHDVLSAAQGYKQLSSRKAQQAAPAAPVAQRTPGVVRLGHIAERKFGLTPSEHPAFGGVEPVHTGGSYHYSNEAIDVGGPVQQPGRRNDLMDYDRFLARRYGSGLTELFFDPGINIDNGEETSPIGGHGTHVHVAVAQPGTRAYPVTGGTAAPAGSPSTPSYIPAGAAPAPVSSVSRRGVVQRAPLQGPVIRSPRSEPAFPFAPTSPRPPSDLLQASTPDELLQALAEAAGRTRRRGPRLRLG